MKWLFFKVSTVVKKVYKKSGKELTIESVFTDSDKVDSAIWENLFNYLNSEGIIKPD
jgi:hypothetical protein